MKKEKIISLKSKNKDFYGVHVASMEGLTKLARLAEIVIPKKEATLLISYPLTKSAKCHIKTRDPNGFTRQEIIEQICENYERIYREEDESTEIEPGMIPGMFNRVQTNGKYGIWGHVIEDLYIEGISYTDENDEVVIEPQIGS